MFADFDWQRVFDKAIEGGIIGGCVGALVAVMMLVVKKRPPKNDEPKNAHLDEDETSPK